MLLQSRQVFRFYKQANRPGLPWSSLDESVALQGLDHFVDRRRRNLEVVLEVGLRGRPAVDLGVVVDEGKVLALLCREGRCNRRIQFWRGIYAYLEGVLAETVESADFDPSSTVP